MPIRWRLTLWFSLILCAILILSGIFIHTLLESYLNDEIDDDLKVNSARVHGTLNIEEIPEPVDYAVIHSSLPPLDEFASPGIYIQLIDTEGKVVVKSNNLGEQELPVDPELIERGFEGQAKIATVSAGEGTDLRIMVSPLFLQNETLLLEVAQSIEPVEEMMSQLRWTLFIGVLTALILAVVSGAVLARRALAPMERITSTAESIEDSSDLSRRVGYDGPKDEIGHLATTFDHMIEHLDRVFKSQKEFVADASHDLRGPLTVLKGNLDLLKRYLVEREHVESLDAMGREIERMTNIANDLLLLAEVESGQMDQQETVSLKEILMEGFRLAQESGKQHNATKGTYLSREIAIGWGRCWQTWSIMPSIIHLRAEVSHYRYFEMVIGPD